MTPTVAVIGASGHGVWHRRVVHRLGERVRLVALCDLHPVPAAEDAPVDGVAQYTSHHELLRHHRPDVVVVATPPHTHLPIALDVLAAGCDLLLEKPPVLDLREHRRLATAVAESGRACQVGFQALASPALVELRRMIDNGRLGSLTGVAVAGAWWRSDGYWARSPWSGRRRLDGRPVMDGALVNPFAHALMQCLAIAGVGPPWQLELERYRARDVEVEDTACLRITTPDGPVVTAAVTLASTEYVAGDITVTGTAGTATLQYPTDVLDGRALPGRVGLLENLLEHRAAGVPLLAPLERTEPFTALAEQIVAAPPPVRLDPARLVAHVDADGGTGLAIPGVAELVRAAAAGHVLLSELGGLGGIE